MTLDKLIVSVVSVIGIAFTYWFFLLKKEKETNVSNSVDIKVEGGFNPSNIVIKKGIPTKITFTRTDPSTCLEEVVISDFRIKKYLPLNKKVTIELNPDHVGESTISCGMNMYHGKIIVK